MTITATHHAVADEIAAAGYPAVARLYLVEPHYRDRIIDHIAKEIASTLGAGRSEQFEALARAAADRAPQGA